MAPERAPPPRKFHCAWYDERTGRVYIAGGIGQDGRPRRDLWAYEVESNRWVWGPEAPEEFWGAYVAVYCESPCVAVILGPVSLAYDMVRGAWRSLAPQGDVPPPKYLAAFARKDNLVYMFGGLYHRQAGEVFSTPCTFSYDLAADRWTYHHAVPPPYQETGLWGASAFYDVVADAFYIMWGLQGWPFADLEEFLPGGPDDWDPSEWDWNQNVYVYRPGGPGAQTGGQPGAGGQPGRPGQPGPGAPSPKERPDEPEAEHPWLEACLIAERLDDSGQPVNLNPTFTGSHDQGYFGFRLSPLCEPLEFRIEVYDASGTRRHTASGTTVDPGEYGVDCLGTYTNWQPFPLGPADSRPLGSWWVELYLGDQLVCVSPFQVDQ